MNKIVFFMWCVFMALVGTFIVSLLLIYAFPHFCKTERCTGTVGSILGISGMSFLLDGTILLGYYMYKPQKISDPSDAEPHGIDEREPSVS
jgi:hypothetical protein